MPWPENDDIAFVEGGTVTDVSQPLIRAELVVNGAVYPTIDVPVNTVPICGLVPAELE